MTMTDAEREVLRRFACAPAAPGTVQKAVKVLANIALKEDAAKTAQASGTKP